MEYPIRARVVSASGVRAMTPAVDYGDCNTCHTNAVPDDAPGRILAP